jgi:hypothetical protein
MKMKFNITYEWEEEIDFEDYDLNYTPQEAMKNFEEWTIDEYYERLNTRAYNILPSGLKSTFTINWEDGRVTKLLTE